MINILSQMDAPALSPEQEEAVVRKWAQEQLKDSRLLQLPRELTCVVAIHVADAAVAEYRTRAQERDKEKLWELMQSTMSFHDSCELCTLRACTRIPAVMSTMCNGCDQQRCLQCARACDRCDEILCIECIDHTCIDCSRMLCSRCTTTTLDGNVGINAHCKDGCASIG